jgi:SH3-like domain-containing protein
MGKGFLITWICVFFAATASASASSERYAVSAPKANIRSGPGTQHEWLWQVQQHYPISVTVKKGNWYFFRDFEGDEGWIHTSLIDKIPTVITTKEKNNIRKGPGSQFEVAFSVGPGISFKVIKTEGSWIHVQHADGDEGWIHKSLVW